MPINIFIIEPWTITALPLHSTNHAKFGRASTCHVIAAFFQFNHSRTVVAFLPPFLLGSLDKLLHGRILRTVPGCVCFVIADCANLGTTLLAFPNLPAMLTFDMFGFDPFAAIFPNAVDSIFGLVFEIFAVPCLLERLVK